MSDPRQINCYIGLKTSRSNPRSVSELAISLVATEEPTPNWALEIACLPLDEVEQALTAQLFKTGILPSGQEFRRALKEVVLTEAKRLDEASMEEATATARKVELFFQLLPDYEFNDASIPIVEFPYPPSRVATPRELKAYLVEHVDQILQIQKM